MWIVTIVVNITVGVNDASEHCTLLHIAHWYCIVDSVTNPRSVLMNISLRWMKDMIRLVSVRLIYSDIILNKYRYRLMCHTWVMCENALLQMCVLCFSDIRDGFLSVSFFRLWRANWAVFWWCLSTFSCENVACIVALPAWYFSLIFGHCKFILLWYIKAPYTSSTDFCTLLSSSN